MPFSCGTIRMQSAVVSFGADCRAHDQRGTPIKSNAGQYDRYEIQYDRYRARRLEESARRRMQGAPGRADAHKNELAEACTALESETLAQNN